MIKYTNPELIGIGERRGRGEIARWSFCTACSNLDVCNVQDTVCLPVAREHPLSLLWKDIQTVCVYEPLEGGI